MREFTVVHLGQSQPVPGGRQLAGQAANLTFESACRLLEAEHSPIATGIITQPLGWYSFTVPQRVEGWVDLGTAVSVQPVPKAAYRSDFRENTNFCPQHDANLGPLAPQASVLPLDHCVPMTCWKEKANICMQSWMPRKDTSHMICSYCVCSGNRYASITW